MYEGSKAAGIISLLVGIPQYPSYYFVLLLSVLRLGQDFHGLFDVYLHQLQI